MRTFDSPASEPASSRSLPARGGRSIVSARLLAAVGLAALLLAVTPPVAAAPTGMPELSEPARTGQRSAADAAVVIGVEDYAYLPDVPYARGDAQAFDDFVRYTRGIPDDRVALLRDARAYEIEKAVKDAGARVGAGGRVWVYFAGHGAMDPNGARRLLLGGDAATAPEAFARFAVAVDDVRAWATAGGGEAVVVVDACYNGGARTGEGVLTGGRRVAVPDYALAASAQATEWTATGPKELSAPLPPLEHGAFTYFAVGALRGWADGEVDGKRDGSVTAEEANRYVARALRTVQAQGQTPQLAASDGARLVLAKGVKEAGPSADALRALRDALGEKGAVASVATTPTPSTASVSTKAGGTGGAAVDDDVAALLREKTLMGLVASKQAEGEAAWRKLAAVLTDGSDAERAAVEKYIAAWSSVKVWVGDAEGRHERAVAIAAVESARGWLATSGKGSAGRDWVSPTLGTMKWIPAGTFRMGDPESHDPDDAPHQVTLTRGYWMMEHEVTKHEWKEVMGTEPRGDFFCGRTCPVERVSWEDAVEFAKRASARDGVMYRLPTEAEWEYAARGGQSYVYAGSNYAMAVGWIGENGGRKPHPVCEKARNGYGLCDMTGNVWEWTADWYGAYGPSHVTDPVGPDSGVSRVYRGGSYWNHETTGEVWSRFGGDPSFILAYNGFRIVRETP